MWRDTSFVTFSLCFFAMTVTALAAVGGGGGSQVKYSESLSVIQIAQCPHDPNNRNKHITGVYLRQGKRELEHVTTQDSPRVNHPVLKLARRGKLPVPANRSALVVAYEPSVSLSLEDNELNCLTRYLYSPDTTHQAMVKPYQALKMNWAVEKLHMTPDSVLAIEVMDEGMGWRSVFRHGGWTSSHRRATRSVQFYNSTAESDDMTILTVVNTVDVFSLTVLVSQNSTLPADSDKWRYTVRVGDVVKDIQRASSHQTQLSLCKTMGTADAAGVVVPWPALIGVAVGVPVLSLLALGLICYCRRSRTSDRASRAEVGLPLVPAQEDHEESRKQDYDELENAVRLSSFASTDSGGTGR